MSQYYLGIQSEDYLNKSIIVKSRVFANLISNLNFSDLVQHDVVL
jgi:hypothetical protein